jgi:hypothetical protein
MAWATDAINLANPGAGPTTKRAADSAAARFKGSNLIVARYLIGTKPTCSTIF